MERQKRVGRQKMVKKKRQFRKSEFLKFEITKALNGMCVPKDSESKIIP